jgi:Zn-dependent oligopeptidase
MARLLRSSWHVTAEQIDALAAGLVATYKSEVARIVATPASAASVATVVRPLAAADGVAATASVAVTLPGYCASPDPAARAASSRAKATLRAMWGAVFEDPALYRVLAAVDAPACTGEDARYLAWALRQCRRAGSHLPDAERTRLAALRQRAGDLCAAFEQTINECSDALWLDEAALQVRVSLCVCRWVSQPVTMGCGDQGVPAAVLAAMERDPTTGRCRVGLKLAEAGPVLTCGIRG